MLCGAGCRVVCVVRRVRVWASVGYEARPQFNKWLWGMINGANEFGRLVMNLDLVKKRCRLSVCGRVRSKDA